MKPSPNIDTDEKRIRQLLEQWADATRMGRSDDILTNHASDAVIFDVLPPLKYEGISAYRKSWDDWQPETVGPGLFDLHELKITAGQDTGFAHALIHCGGTRGDGTTIDDWVRATFCLRKIVDRWLIVHQHISMPINM
jgi:ketosteroid isomerase-like protein